jgi:hypothetical protein
MNSWRQPWRACTSAAYMVSRPDAYGEWSGVLADAMDAFADEYNAFIDVVAPP